MNTIVIPRNALIVLCGPAGCGKSTWAARHFSPTQIVSSDACRAIVSDDPANQQATPHAFDLMNFIIGQRLALGRLTVADAASVTRQDRKQFLKIAAIQLPRRACSLPYSVGCVSRAQLKTRSRCSQAGDQFAARFARSGAFYKRVGGV